MLASSPRASDDDSGPADAGFPLAERRLQIRRYGVCVGAISAYEMRIQADCVGLRKYGGLRYFSRVS